MAQRLTLHVVFDNDNDDNNNNDNNNDDNRHLHSTVSTNCSKHCTMIW